MQTLKYIFTAGYKDGTVYKQNAEDRSVKEPEKRSCYFDIDHDKLAYFILTGEDHEYGVDLRDGHFEIDGVPFEMQQEHKKVLPNGKTQLIPLKDFRLIFFREHTHYFKMQVKSGKQTEVKHEIVNKLGWQCTVDGQNYQQIMRIK